MIRARVLAAARCVLSGAGGNFRLDSADAAKPLVRPALELLAELGIDPTGPCSRRDSGRICDSHANYVVARALCEAERALGIDATDNRFTELAALVAAQTTARGSK